MTDHALELELRQIQQILEQKETEENWTKQEEAVSKLSKLTVRSYTVKEFPLMIKKLKGGINSCLTTERTRLARTTLLFIQELSTCLGDGFDQLADIFFPTIIKLTTRANKVYVSSASQTLKICIENSGASSTIPLFLEQLKNPSKTARIASVEALVLILSNNTPQDLEQFVDLIENAISTAVVDSSVEVRDLARQVFEQYRVSFEQRTEKFVDQLQETARKYLRVEKVRSRQASEKFKSPFKEDETVLRHALADPPKRIERSGPRPLEQGPARILREKPPEVGKLKQKPQRVLIESAPTTPATEKPEPKLKRFSVPNLLRHSSSTSLSSDHEIGGQLSDLRQKMRSTDWSQRCLVFETVAKAYESNGVVDFKTKATSAVFKLVLEGLNDGHFKVNLAAIQALEKLFRYPESSVQVLDQVIPKLCQFSHGPQRKPALKDAAQELMNRLLDDHGSQVIVQAILNQMSSQKTRGPMVGWLSEMNQEHWNQYLVKPNATRLLLSKLSVAAADGDLQLKKLVNLLSEWQKDLFWTSFSGLKPLEKKQYNLLFSKDLEKTRQLQDSPKVKRSPRNSLTPKSSMFMTMDELEEKTRLSSVEFESMPSTSMESLDLEDRTPTKPDTKQAWKSSIPIPEPRLQVTGVKVREKTVTNDVDHLLSPDHVLHLVFGFPSMENLTPLNPLQEQQEDELEQFLNLIKHGECWEEKGSQVVTVLLESLSSRKRTSRSIRNGLYLIKEILKHQHRQIEHKAGDILNALLGFEMDHTNTEQMIEMAQEMDRTFKVWRASFDPQVQLDALMLGLKVQESKLLYEFLYQILGQTQMNPDQEMELVTHLANSLDAPHAATRKAAFDLFAKILLDNDKFGDSVYRAIRQQSGLTRESILRSMVSQMRQ